MNLLLGSLAGEAKREVLVLEEENRDKIDKIFDVLARLYGDQLPLSVIRSQFFSCKQKPEKPLRAFALRLRELHHQLRTRHVDDAPSDIQLRDQLLLGLREGSLRQALRTFVRHHPDKSFQAVYGEAQLLEEEHQRPEAVSTVCAIHGRPPPRSPSPPDPSWKQELKEELLGDLRAHIQEWTQEFLEEHQPRQAPVPVRARPISRDRFQWTEDGQPICFRCGQPGHMGRECGGRQRRPGPLKEQSLPPRSRLQGPRRERR